MHRTFLRAALLTQPLKPALAEVPQTPQAACCPVNAIPPCCEAADPARQQMLLTLLDGKKTSCLPASQQLCTSVGVFLPPSFYNFSAKLFLSSGLHPICLRCVEVLCPELHRGLHPWPPPADGASRVLKEVLAGCTRRDVCLLCSSPVSLVCLATPTPKSFL